MHSCLGQIAEPDILIRKIPWEDLDLIAYQKRICVGVSSTPANDVRSVLASRLRPTVASSSFNCDVSPATWRAPISTASLLELVETPQQDTVELSVRRSRRCPAQTHVRRGHAFMGSCWSWAEQLYERG